jgi:hypothetical protein
MKRRRRGESDGKERERAKQASGDEDAERDSEKN